MIPVQILVDPLYDIEKKMKGRWLHISDKSGHWTQTLPLTAGQHLSNLGSPRKVRCGAEV